MELKLVDLREGFSTDGALGRGFLEHAAVGTPYMAIVCGVRGERLAAMLALQNQTKVNTFIR